MADIGCADGVSAKVLAAMLGCKQLDMYEPFVAEYPLLEDKAAVAELKRLKIGLQGLDTNFFAKPFDDDVSEKYDIISVVTTFHHIMNPTTVMEQIRKQLRPGGLLLVREHRPTNDFEKMYLDVYDKFYGFGMTREFEYDEERMQKDLNILMQHQSDGIYYYPSSYFTFDELKTLIGSPPVSDVPEDKNYDINGFMHYMYWKF
jgi:SAM-dependent methyltransferase